MAKFTQLSLIYILFCVYIDAAPFETYNSLSKFKQFATAQLSRQNCSFPPRFVFAKVEQPELFPYKSCMDETRGEFTRVLCEKIMTLTNEVCSIAIETMRVSEREVIYAGPLETYGPITANLLEKVSTMCQTPEFRSLDKQNSCAQECARNGSFFICDLYHAMDKAEKAKFKDIKDFKNLDWYISKVPRHAYPPLGTIMESQASFHPCLDQSNADNVTKELCSAVLSVAASISDQSLPELDEIQFIKNTAANAIPCGQFPTLQSLQSDIFGSLTDPTKCALICVDHRKKLCNALSAGMKVIAEVANQATSAGSSPPVPANEIKASDLAGSVLASGNDASNPEGSVPASGNVAADPAGSVSASGNDASNPAGTVPASGNDASNPAGSVPASGTVASNPAGSIPASGNVASNPAGSVSASGNDASNPAGSVPASGNDVSNPAGSVPDNANVASNPAGSVPANGNDASNPAGSVPANGNDASNPANSVPASGSDASNPAGSVPDNANVASNPAGSVPASGNDAFNPAGSVPANGNAAANPAGSVPASGNDASNPAGSVPASGNDASNPAGSVPASENDASNPAGSVPASGNDASNPAGSVPDNANVASNPAGSVPASGNVASNPAGSVPPSGNEASNPAGSVPANGNAAANPANSVPASGNDASNPAGSVPANGNAAANPANSVPASGNDASNPAGSVPANGNDASNPANSVPASGSDASNPAGSVPASGNDASSTAALPLGSNCVIEEGARCVDGAVCKTGLDNKLTCQCQDGYKLNADAGCQKMFSITTESQTTGKTVDYYFNNGDDGDDNLQEASDNNKPVVIKNKYVEEEENGGIGFISYFLVITVLVVAGYLVFHNKQKIIALVVEGKGAGRNGNGRRPNTKEYRQLKTEDVMPSLEKTATSKDYVF